jgi:putative DNA methylase
MTDTRLIERWLPIAALGEESVRERRSMTALPPNYYLHVWWARRPLVASRAAILASLLPDTASKEPFLRAIGIHGDPIAAKKRIAIADRKGERLGADAYGYQRAFSWLPDQTDRDWINHELKGACPVILDPTAGGGSIPLESVRLGFTTYGNDLNPVAALIERATIEFPLRFGDILSDEIRKLGKKLTQSVRERLRWAYPDETLVHPDTRPDAYIWARTITCPYCEGVVPLSPNWRLAPDGRGVRIVPQCNEGPLSSNRRCEFEIVKTVQEHSPGTVADGDATCPFPDCTRVIEGAEIKSQAQTGKMGEQLYAVVVKKRIETRKKNGSRGKDKWERAYRAPLLSDDNSAEIVKTLEGIMPEWDANDIIPREAIPLGLKTTEPQRYGMTLWRDLFNPRQLLGHGTAVEAYRELLEDEKRKGLTELSKAAFVYLSLSIDKMLNYNSRMSVWMSTREVIANTFNRHDFAFCWSYAEMSPLVEGNGYDWAVEQTAKCVGELVELVRPDVKHGNDLLSLAKDTFQEPSVTITCGSGDSLDYIENASVDVVVMDPPYYDNVMYAELSDYFYVWLKRTAGYVVPELFVRQLTDKENEAVANPSKFAGEKSARVIAGRDYQERMQRIFAECRRVMKPNGIMTLMFTHKATGAWDALTKGLIEAGFAITASWPINTEAEGSLHIKDKSAANSTIFLVCRPRDIAARDAAASYWEDVEPDVARAVRARVKEFQDSGIGGVDLYLASFGPALEEFSKHWPLKRGTPRPKPEALKRRKQAELFEEEWDPYAVTPEDALDAARREVKRWRLEQLTHLRANTELDPLTSFFVLAWDAFRAPVFPYDEALRLARAVGVDLDTQVVGVLTEKKGANLLLLDSARRAAKGALGPVDGSRAMIDAIHHAAHLGRTKNLQAAQEMLSKAQVDGEPAFLSALEAVLEVLPVSQAFSGVKLDGDLAAAGSDFEALENLRKLAFSEQISEPQQLELWRDSEAA